MDYSNDGTFVPVLWFELLWTLLVLEVINNWKIHQFDIKGAYLHGTLHETIFMQQPEGFNNRSGHVCRLIWIKTIWKVWNEEFSSMVIKLGLTQLKTDYCCFIWCENNNFTIITVWVDDILSFLLTDTGNNWIKQELKRKFKVNSNGNPIMILGIKLIKKNNFISISQAHFVENLDSKMWTLYQHSSIPILT